MPPSVHNAPARNLDAKLIVREHVVNVKKPVFEDYPVEKPVFFTKDYEVPNVIVREVEKIVEVPRVVFKDVIVERPVWKDIIVDRITYKDVLIERPVYVDKTVNVPQVTIREEVRIVPKLIEKEEIRHKFVDRTVEVPKFRTVQIDKAIINDGEYVCQVCKQPSRRPLK